MQWVRMLQMVTLALAGALAGEGAEIIAHRGASHDAPENSVAAAKLAWEQDADAVEVDIHLTKDKRIIVIHDYDTKRVAGVEKKVSEQTFAELRQLDAGSWKDAKWAGEKLPSLEEVIATVPPGKKLVIEIKSGVDTVGVLADAIMDSPKRGQFVVIAFSFDVASEAKKRLTGLPVYWLWGFSEREKKEYGDPSLDDLIAKAKGAGLDGLDLNYKGPLTKEFVADVKRAGMVVIVYTVDDPVAA
jgi:glycerophosphoryl diester phosphodiesterase